MAASTSSSGLTKDRSVPGTSASSDNGEEGINMAAERKNSTKTILEDVCMDFESMDVISPAKANKSGVVKNVKNISKPDQSPKMTKNSAATSTKISDPSDEKASSTKDVTTKISDASDEKATSTKDVTTKISDASDKRASATKDVTTLSSNTQVRIIEPTEVELTANQIALVSEFVSGSDQSCDAQDVTDIINLPESAVKNIASLAQLADAEIVQTGDNVSIIVSNPRLIEVLTNPDNTAAVMDAAGNAYLETNLGGAQLLDQNIFQTMDIANVVQETVITEEGHEISSSSRSKARTVYGSIKGRTNKSLFKPVYSSSASTLKARRVTAKMKAEWTRQLKRKGRLSCQMPGCSQTYITVANFTTHYKYCTGKDGLQLCLYCKSLIFSSHKAMLQHMEVEHPDKVEQFKAAYPFEEELEIDESGASSLILSEDDVALNIAEVSHKNAKKCKLSSKENIVLPKRTILKHKLQSIQNSMAENAKEFKKCVKFDNIVDKINSVEDLCKVESIPGGRGSKPKEKRRRVILTESIVAEKKYFEDDDDPAIVEEPKDEPVEEDTGEEVHTKARMVLNRERYKRYKEYLKLTRDWSSERKTYSRGRGSDVSSDSSFLLNSLNESVEDVHQLSRTAESSSISLNATETDLEMSSLPPLLESESLVSLTEASEKLIDSLISLANKTAEDPNDKKDVIPFDRMGDQPPTLVNETVVTKEPENVVEKNVVPGAKIRRNRPCYSRASQELSPKPRPRYQAIITYGVNVPARASKPEEEPVTFDSLVSSFKSGDSARRNSQSAVDVVTEVVESAPPKLEKGEGKIEKAAVLKRKRGRPPKPKPESPAEVKKEAKNKKEDMKNAKNYSTAMLKSIEKNVRNRKIRLFGIKKNSKFKAKSKMYLHSKQSSLKNKKSKQSKRTLMAKNIIKRRSVKAKSIDESAIQCQENIDNHLMLGNESSVIPHIQCLPSDHNYTNSEVVIDANNVVGEVEVITSNADNVSQSLVEDNHAKSVGSYLINEVNAPTPSQCILNISAEKIPQVSTTSLQSTETEKEVEKNVLDQNDKKPSDSLEEQQNDVAMEQATASVEQDAAVVIPETQSRTDEALSTNEPPSLEPQRVCDKEVSSQQDIGEAEKISSNEEQLENISVSQKDIQAASEIVETSNSELLQLNVKEAQPLSDVSATAGHSDSLMECDKTPGGTENIEISATVESHQVKPEQEVTVKRRRGRPKKNSVPLPTTDVSNFASPLESTPIVNADKSKMDASNEGQVGIETPGLMTDDSNGTPNLRKSERVRRRKLVTENLLEASPIEIKPKEEMVTVRTGRRGRPRKYSAKEMSAELSESQMEETVPGTSQTETEPVVGSRKLSRKSRPRKCVRYADLNTGIDSSESMDGLSGGASTGKDKPESPKLKGRSAAQKPSNETDLDGKKKVVEGESYSNDQDGKIVLPLKKRKQRQTKKDDSVVVESADATRNKEDPEEVLLSDEEENAKDAESKTPKRVRKGTKRKQGERGGSDTSDEEWDISSYLRPSARKRQQQLSAQELLELEEEEESSDSYSSGTEDESAVRMKKKKSHETSGTRRSSIRSFSRAKHLQLMIESQQHLKDNILQKYKPKKSMWTRLCDEDYYAALPSLKKSVFFKIENMWNNKESFWNSLDFFDSGPIDKESSHCTFFTGGPVLCSAWCPTPTNAEVPQYVALASSFSTNKLNSFVCTEVEKCSIQLWNVGILKGKTVQSKPSMVLSIFLQCGPVADMVWCPEGCWEDPSSARVEDNLPRLGLLALACADGNVRIYSIPHPQCVSSKGAELFPVFSASPSVLLEPMQGEVCAVTRRSMCLSVCWQKSDDFEHIAAGYGNGMICLWRINHSSMILTVEKDNELKFHPYLVFNAHGTPVYGISFASLPGNRFLVSSSIDRTLKFWDLIDTSVPFFSVKKGAGRGVEWASHYCGAFGALEHGMNCFKGCCFFKECGNEKFQSRTLSGASCCLMKSTLSEWLNAVALADMSGTVSVSFMYNLLQEHAKSPMFLQRPVYKSELQLVEGIVDKIAFSSYPETVSVVGTLQEMSAITGVVHNLVETCCEDASDLEITTGEQLSSSSQKSSPDDYNEELGSVKCLTEVEEMVDVVSVVHEILDGNLDEGDVAVCTEGEQLLTQDEVSHKEDSNGESNGSKQTETDQHLVAGTGLPFDLSEITDVISTLVDVQDTADIVNDVGDVVTSVMTIRDVVDSVDHLRDVTSIMDKLKDLIEESDGQTDTEQHLVAGTGPPFNLAEITDVVSTLVDLQDTADIVNDVGDVVTSVMAMREVVDSVDHLRDVTSVMDKLKDLIEIHCSTDFVVPLRIMARHLIGRWPSTADIDVSPISDFSRVETGDVGSLVAYKEEVLNLCNLLLTVTKESKGKEEIRTDACSLVDADEMESNGSEQIETRQHSVAGTGSSFNLVEITDVVTTPLEDVQDTADIVNDMEDVVTSVTAMKEVIDSVDHLTDVTSVMDKLKDLIEGYSATDFVVPLRLIARNLVGRLPSTAGIDVSPISDLSRKETVDVGNPVAYKEEVLTLCNLILSVTNELEANGVVIGRTAACSLDDEMQFNKSKVSDNQDLDTPSENENAVRISPVVKELNPVTLSLESCVNCKAEVCHCPTTAASQESNHKFSILPDEEEMDEPMLSAEEDSSASENDMDSEDDELEASNSYLFDQDSNFSGDSVLSECSLDSNISMCSSSGESDISEASSSSVPGEQVDIGQNFDEFENQPREESGPNSPAAVASIESASDSDCAVAAEIVNGESYSNVAVAQELEVESMDVDLPSDLVVSTSDGSDNPLVIEDGSDNPVQIADSSETPVIENGVELLCDETHKDNSDSPPEALNVPLSVEIVSELPPGGENDSINGRPSEETGLADSAEMDQKLHNADSVSIEVVNEDICVSNQVSGKTDCNNVNNTHPENNLDGQCENLSVGSETVEIAESAVSNVDNICEEEINSTVDNLCDEEISSAVDNAVIINSERRNLLSTKSFLTYEDIASEYGIVFKDMNTAQFESIEDDKKAEEVNSSLLDHYHLPSIKALSWNPNFGSHSWLFSGGLSGLARLSYVSDINRPNTAAERTDDA